MMPPTKTDPQSHSSKEIDKRRKKFCCQSGELPQKSSDNGLSTPSYTPQLVAFGPASVHPAGNRLGTDLITPTQFAPTSPRYPSLLSENPQSRSGKAIGHILMRKKSSPVKKDKKKAKENRDSHPLNLPPDELRSLSAAMAAQEGARDLMDIDSNVPDLSQNVESPASPVSTAPGAFPEIVNSIVNGVNGDHEDEKSPTPPPHRVQTMEKPPVDAEVAKAAGNKFFKAKDYSRAIVEYSKGG